MSRYACQNALCPAALFAVLFCSVCLLLTPANAQQFTISLDTGTVTVMQGKTAVLMGTITNNNSGSITFFGYSIGGPKAYTSVVSTNQPLSGTVFTPGMSFHGTIAQIDASHSDTIPSTLTPVGTYAPFLQTSSSTIAVTTPFLLNVVPAPEPSSLVTLTAGVLGLGLLAIRSRRVALSSGDSPSLK